MPEKLTNKCLHFRRLFARKDVFFFLHFFQHLSRTVLHSDICIYLYLNFFLRKR
ncbi:hypothetical protein BC629DRAFT_271403 [Irpex lacteus]|nr:hypothetical protein BC629DRAFT_271403 [Irpex lacteus]